MTTPNAAQRQETHDIADGLNRVGSTNVHRDEEGTGASGENLLRWTNIVAASAVLFIGVGYTNTFGVFQEYYQTTLFPHESPLKLLLIGSVASSLYLILGAFAGRFADLVGYRISLVVGSALMVGAMFCASVSQTYWHFFLSQGLMFGLGIAFAYLPAVTISRQFFSRRHGLANGIVVSGGALGGCVLPYAVRDLIVRLGLPGTFRVLAYIALGVLVPSVMLLRPRARAGIQEMSRDRRPPIIDLSLLSDNRFIVLLLAGTLAMTGFLPRYFLITPSARAKGISDVYAAWLLGLMNGLSIIGRIGIGWLADQRGKVTALVASFILCGLGHFAFWLPGVAVSSKTSATAFFTIFSVYTGVFGSGFISLFPVVVAHLFGSANLASKVGLLNTITGLGTLAGPAAVYSIVGEGAKRHWAIGVLSAGMFMFLGGVAMAGGLSQMSKRERRREQAHSMDRL